MDRAAGARRGGVWARRGGVWAQAELRKVLSAMGGRAVEAELPVARAHELMGEGRLELAPEQAGRLDEILAELVAMAEELRTERGEAVAA